MVAVGSIVRLNDALTGWMVEATVAKYRGPGNVKAENFHFTATKGGKPMEAFAGKAAGTITFDKAGDYVVHITLNDYSEKGGGATGCCCCTTRREHGTTQRRA